LRPSGATLTQELTAPRQRGVVLRARPRLAAQSGACRSDWCSYIPPVFSTTLALPPAGGQNKQGLFCLVLGTSGGGRRLDWVLAKCGLRRGNHSWQRGFSSGLTI
jgi:hypothetical protein